VLLAARVDDPLASARASSLNDTVSCFGRSGVEATVSVRLVGALRSDAPGLTTLSALGSILPFPLICIVVYLRKQGIGENK